MTREELLEALYDHVWNKMATYESDNPGFALVSFADLEAQEEICMQIEAMTQ